jgi:hypothetical protein
MGQEVILAARRVSGDGGRVGGGHCRPRCAIGLAVEAVTGILKEVVSLTFSNCQQGMKVYNFSTCVLYMKYTISASILGCFQDVKLYQWLKPLDTHITIPITFFTRASPTETAHVLCPSICAEAYYINVHQQNAV